MKNLKKVLAFVLVVAMMASLVISASALSAKDFSDYSEIVNKDAVAMLTELKVINGYPTGDYQPSNVVTRAEMAKMIYTALMGGNDSAPVQKTNKYSDVWSGMWCEGYVAFCDELGIIAGYGDGTFGPNDPVTAVQAAKMLLVAMGYDAAKEGFVADPQWNYNILKVASAKGLFEGFTADTGAGCTRDDAALLIYNALLAEKVTYVGTAAVDNGTTLMGEQFGLVAVTGVVVANEYANLFDTEPLKAGYTEIAFIGDQYVDMDHAIDPMKADFFTKWYAGKLSSDDYTIGDFHYGDGSVGIGEEYLDMYDWAQLKDHVNDNDEYESFVFSVSTDLAQVGQTVTVFAKLKGAYEKFTNLVEYNAYDMFSGKVVGNVVVDDDSLMATAENGEYLFVKTDNNTRYYENYAAVWANVDGVRPYAFNNNVDANNANNTSYSFYFDGEDALSTVRGERAWAFDNDHDGVAEIVIKTRQTFAVVKYDSYYDTYTFDTESDIARTAWCGADGDLYDWTNVHPSDIVFDGELKEGMKVLVMPVDGTYYVVEAETVTGVPTTKYYNKEAKEYNVEIDGTVYFESGLYWADDVVEAPKPGGFGWSVVAMKGIEYLCYLDEFGNIVAYEDLSKPAATEYFLVTGAAHEIQSLNVTDSIVFGARESKDTVVGATGYYAGRYGRGNDVITSVAPLYDDNANSTDKVMAGVVASASQTIYNYVSYMNVFEVVNKYNFANNVQYGQYTNLVEALFSEDDVLSAVYGINNEQGELDLIKYDVSRDIAKGEVNSKTDKIGDNYLGKSTKIFIYMVDVNTGKYNVISTTGYNNLPTMKVADKTATNEADTYGIVNVYGVDDSGRSVDVPVIVFELEVEFAKGYGLPEKSMSDYVYIYDVDTITYGTYCQHIYAIDAKGEMVDFYYDCYTTPLTAKQTGWYAIYKTDANTECTEGHDHYALAKRTPGDDVVFSDSVYQYTDSLKVTADDNVKVNTRTHDTNYSVSFGYDVVAGTYTVNDAYIVNGETKIYLHCDTNTGAYNDQECVPTTLGTMQKYNDRFGLIKEISQTEIAIENATVIYKEGRPGEIEVIAIIVNVNCDYWTYDEMCYFLEVAAAESTASDVMDPADMPAPPAE